MSQNIEIEFKNILSKEEFNRFLSHFQVKSTDFFKQENHYFDTKDFALKQQGSALRIRVKASGYEMTLKQPHPDGLLETNEILSQEQVNSLLNGGKMINGIIKKQISAMNIDTNLLYNFGSLVTERAEIQYRGGLLVFDSSSYLNVQDYEVEYEVTNRALGEPIFLNLLAELNIPIRKAKNKVKRFYERKKMLDLQ